MLKVGDWKTSTCHVQGSWHCFLWCVFVSVWVCVCVCTCRAAALPRSNISHSFCDTSQGCVRGKELTFVCSCWKDWVESCKRRRGTDKIQSIFFLPHPSSFMLTFLSHRGQIQINTWILPLNVWLLFFSGAMKIHLTLRATTCPTPRASQRLTKLCLKLMAER